MGFAYVDCEKGKLTEYSFALDQERAKFAPTMLASFPFPFFCFFVFCFVFPVLGFCFCCVAFGFIPGAFTPEPAPELKERPPGGLPGVLPKPLPVPIPPLCDTRDPPRPIPGPLGPGVPLPGG